MTPSDYLEAARVPKSVQPQTFGLWIIERRPAPAPELVEAAGFGVEVGWPDYTLLRRLTTAKMHCDIDGQEIVMEDSRQELQRHLPIWLAAHGRVLVTGLGLGCVVRGLLASPAVEHIDVVEIDGRILDIIGPEFEDDRRVTLHHGDALTYRFPRKTRWQIAWHDLWCEGNGLQRMHCELFKRFMNRCERQGAWQFPRELKRLAPSWILR